MTYGFSGAGSRAAAASSELVSTAATSAWSTMRVNSGPARRVLVGTATAPALCTAAYATIQRSASSALM